MSQSGGASALARLRVFGKGRRSLTLLLVNVRHLRGEDVGLGVLVQHLAAVVVAGDCADGRLLGLHEHHRYKLRRVIRVGVLRHDMLVAVEDDSDEDVDQREDQEQSRDPKQDHRRLGPYQHAHQRCQGLVMHKQRCLQDVRIW